MISGDYLESKLIQGPGEPGGPRLQLVHAGHLVGDPLAGARIVQQFQLDDQRLLLFLVDDSPYEETLRIDLFSPTFERLDGLELSFDFTTGSLDDVQLIDPRTIEFDFIHKRRCRLRVLDQPARLSMQLPTVGVRRTGKWLKRYLEFSLIG